MKFRPSTLLLIIGSVTLSACGGSGTGTKVSPPPGNFAIGGSVTGLLGAGLVLQDNGGDNLSVTANGTFTFATRVTALGPYNVTVLTQPSSPSQVCTVSSGSGTASTDITTVLLACANTYTVGGAVSGLSGTGLVLQNNGADNLSITENGAFTFAATATSGSAYAVTVLTQPSSPAQACTVTNGSGIATADVTTVQVSCSSNVSNEWTWMGGANATGSPGNYGIQGVAAPTNTPGSRDGAVGWKDGSGNFWLFGGFGAASSGNANNLSDLWKYSAGEWTWVAGPDSTSQLGIYGTLGQASPTNAPGARFAPATWIDSQGGLWLFGGVGSDANSIAGELNDLWKFSAGEWTWVSGSSTHNQAGVYGTMGTAAPSNAPGARDSAFYWTDLNGNFWLFGGDGYDSAGALGQLNDLWEYSAGEWTWVGGSMMVGQAGTYGTQGVASPNNFPGARDSGSSATDSDGNLWLFGGRVPDSGAQFSTLNDLWKYSGGQWTWVSGSSTKNQIGVYGTQGVAAPGNVPGARRDGVMVFDSAGNLWLFGGEVFNDLWKFSGGEWTWVSGSNLLNQTGTYGTLGTPSPNDSPGSRGGSVRWIDSSDNIWIFGGLGLGPTNPDGNLNDLWRYTP